MNRRIESSTEPRKPEQYATAYASDTTLNAAEIAVRVAIELGRTVDSADPPGREPVERDIRRAGTHKVA